MSAVIVISSDDECGISEPIRKVKFVQKKIQGYFKSSNGANKMERPKLTYSVSTSNRFELLMSETESSEDEQLLQPAKNTNRKRKCDVKLDLAGKKKLIKLPPWAVEDEEVFEEQRLKVYAVKNKNNWPLTAKAMRDQGYDVEATHLSDSFKGSISARQRKRKCHQDQFHSRINR